MLFSSPVFFAFFAIYFLFHLITPRPARIFLIIIGSAVFYGWWKFVYLWLPFLLTAIAYGAVLWIENTSDPIRRKRRLTIAIIVLFLPLIFFKYTDFIYRDVLGPFLGFQSKILDIPLPLGVSFITFTLTAYIVDVYRGRFQDRPSFSKVLAYVLFFPHLIAGPILRPNELMPQLERPRSALDARFEIGIAIFTLGLVKKVVFADQIATVVDAVYSGTQMPSAPTALLAIYGFSMQIYCDFSGYTDMAIGLALIIGIRLPNNFLRPYAAMSLVDFWRRWHITLSFWLRDYLYIPLGGNRGSALRSYFNILVTMVLGGLWHGANWTFVVWGFLHGVGISFVHLLRTSGNRAAAYPMPKWFGIFITFHFVTVLWVFFRAPDLTRAGQILAAPFVGGWGNTGGYLYENVASLMLLAIFFLLHGLDDHRKVKLAMRRIRPEIVWPAVVILWAFAMTVSQGGSAKFIYFDF